MKKINILVLFVFLLCFSCSKNAVTGKRSMTLLPESEMIAMSLTEYDKFLNEHPPLPDQDDRVILVRKVGTKIQQAVEQFYKEKNATKDLAGFNWTFNVVDENTVNAWCMPGGKVVVYTGLLPVTLTEEGLAVVMGHEIAHAIARHGNQRMSQAMAIQGLGTGLSIALSQQGAATQQVFQQAYGLGTGLGTLAYSRGDETEADKMGIIFAAMAGYNPEEAVSFWQRMSAGNNGQKPPEFLSTHPSDEKRIKDLKAFMPEAKKYYKPQ
jgi:predicted Zn-dependent protease